MTTKPLSLRTKSKILFKPLEISRAATFLCLLFIQSILFAQSLDSSSFIQIGPYEGKANFQYAVINRDTVLEGEFEAEGAFEDELDKTSTHYFKIKGHYSKNKPNEVWKFEVGKLKKSGSFSLVDYNLQSKVNGRLHQYEVEFQEGELSGKMKHQLYQIKESSMGNARFEGNFYFENGTLNGAYAIKNDQLNLSGQIADGLADGTWTFESNNERQLETWEFSAGKLNHIQWNYKDSSEVIHLFPKVYEASTQIELSENFLKILSFHLSFKNKQALHPAVSELVHLNDSLISQMEEFLDDLGAKNHVPNPLVSVPYFPLNEREEEQLDLIKSRIARSDSLQLQIAKNYQIRVLKHSNDTLLYCLETIQLLEKELFAKCKKLLDLNTDSILQFLPRSKLNQLLAIDTLKKDHLIRYGDSASKRISLPISSSLQLGSVELNSVVMLSNIALDSLEKYYSIIDQVLIKYQKQQKLVKMEEQLLKEHDIFMNLIDSLILKTNDPYKSSISRVKAFSNYQFEDYWSKESDNDRLMEISNLLECLQKVSDLALSIAEIPTKNEEITQLYTTTLYNTFTLTNMNEIVKKRIYNTYTEILLPYFLSEIENNLSCSSSASVRRNIQETHRRIIELRTEKTSKLEKKLSRNISAKEALELLEVIPKRTNE